MWVPGIEPRFSGRVVSVLEPSLQPQDYQGFNDKVEELNHFNFKKKLNLEKNKTTINRAYRKSGS